MNISHFSWSKRLFYDCIMWSLLTLSTVGYHLQPQVSQSVKILSTDDLSQTTMGQILCGLCAMCGMMIITVPIPMLVSSFAITYKSKLWRTKISTKRRLMQGKVPKKTNILLNLASSSGMSGVLT